MKVSGLIILIIILAIFPCGAKAQWNQIPSSPSGTVKDIAHSDGIIFLGHLGQGVFLSTDSAATWQQLSDGLNSMQSRAVYQLLIFGGNLYAATIDGIYKSSDDGQNWHKRSDGITIGPGALYEFTESIFEHNDVLFTGAWNGIYRSTDSGESWQITNVSGQGVGPGFFINHFGTLFAARESINYPYGYLSSDGGVMWEQLTTISMPTITFRSEPNRLWSGTIHGVWLSTDNGASWEHRSEGLPPDPYNSSIIRVNGKLVSSVKFGGSGIYYSDDDGENWIDFGEGLTFLSTIEELIVFGDRIFAATSDGLWQRDTTDIVTGLAENRTETPRTFRLMQNYPNPFNARTTIQFFLPERSDIEISISDILGRRVESIRRQVQPPGYGRVIWNARDLPSGIYLLRLQAGDLVETGRMQLLK